jgi:hypothetical protein
MSNAVGNLEQIARDCYEKHITIMNYQFTAEVDGEQVKYCSLTPNPGSHRRFCAAHGEEIEVKTPYRRRKSVYTCTRDGG